MAVVILNCPNGRPATEAFNASNLELSVMLRYDKGDLISAVVFSKAFPLRKDCMSTVEEMGLSTFSGSFSIVCI